MRTVLGFVLLAALLVAVAAFAAETAPPSATLRFFNRDIATLRATYYGVPPAERAAHAAGRIRYAVHRGGPGAVEMVIAPDGLNVTIDGVFVFRMLEGDLDAIDGQTFEEARSIVGARLNEAIAAARSSVWGRALLRELILTVLALAAFYVAVWILIRVRAWFRRRVDAYLARRLRMREPERAAITKAIHSLGHFVILAATAVLAEECLRFVFDLYPYSRPWSHRLTGYVMTVAEDVGGAAVDATPGLLMVAVAALLAYFVSKVVAAAAHGIATGRYRILGIDADSVDLARRLATAVIWLFTLAMAYPYLPGASSDAFKGLTVLVGLMLSLGASSLVGQAAGGLIITFGHVLRPGDWVRVADVEGAVTKVGMFATRIRTPLDEDVNVPNTVILASVSRNFSRPATSTSSILETSVTIGYNAPWRQVHAMLLEGAARTADLEHEPAPEVLQTALSDFYVQYSLRVRIKDQLRRPQILSKLCANVQDVFNEYGVQIMSPHYLGDPAAPVVVPKARWFSPPATAGAAGKDDESSADGATARGDTGRGSA